MLLNLPFRQERLELFCSELWSVVADQRGRDPPSCAVYFQHTDYCYRCSLVGSFSRSTSHQPFPPTAKVFDHQQVVFAAPSEQVSSDFRPGNNGLNRHEGFFLWCSS